MVLAPAADQALARRALERGANDFIVTEQIDTRSLVQLIAMMFERRASDEQKFVERERAEVTLNSIGDAVMTTDTLGNVTYLNAEAEGLTGWTRAEAFARPLAEVFDVTDGLTGQHGAGSVAPGDRAQEEGPPQGQLHPGRPRRPRDGDRAFGRADSRSPGQHPRRGDRVPRRHRVARAPAADAAPRRARRADGSAEPPAAERSPGAHRSRWRAATAAASRSCSSTAIASSTSTTRSATPSATRCCARSRSA